MHLNGQMREGGHLSLLRVADMVRHFPKVVFLAVMAFAALMSADLGPRFVRTDNVVVWYEGPITAEQAQTVLQQIAREIAEDESASKTRRYAYRLTRGPAGVCLRFEDIDFAKLSPEVLRFVYEYAQQLGSEAFPGETLVVEVSDGAGRVETIAPPTAEVTETVPETAAVSG